MVLCPAASQDRCQSGTQGLEELRSLTEENCVVWECLGRLAEKLKDYPDEPCPRRDREERI